MVRSSFSCFNYPLTLKTTWFSVCIYRMDQKLDCFFKVVTPVYDDTGKQSIHQIVQFIIKAEFIYLSAGMKVGVQSWMPWAA